jgi:hypothetical protein
MPPRKRIGPTANQIYKSSTPLKQTKLTAPKKRIRSYGKKSSAQIPKSDNTLTQMDWLKRQQMLEMEQQEDDKDEFYEAEFKKPNLKRRKTTGDEPSATAQLHTQTISQVWSVNSGLDGEEEGLSKGYEKENKNHKSKRRKTAGDEPSRTPQFYTQTLTQLDRSCNSALEEEDSFVFSVPSSSQSAKPVKNIKKSLARKAKKSVTIPPPSQKSLLRDMPPPRTPHRTMPTEIPSSQSPGTPLSIHSRGSAGSRSPFNEVSINTPIPFNSNSKPQGSPLMLPKLEVQSSAESGAHASQSSRIPSSPSKRSSPGKNVRFVLPDVEEEVEEDEEEKITPPSTKPETTSCRVSELQSLVTKSTRTEIFDSDAESEDELEMNTQRPASTAQLEEEEITEPKAEDDVDFQGSAASKDDDRHAEADSFYGDIGVETQFEAEKMMDSPSHSDIAPATQAQADSDSKMFQERTQMMESQRLATQYMDTMAPRTASSDIFISIPPQHLLDLLGRARDHIIRAYSFPPTVCRVWIFETKPVSALKYMAEIGHAKLPGEISDESGLENAKFNTRAGSWTAYEVLQLYELSDPLPWAKLKANEWLSEAPKKFARVGPAVIDQLVANLKMSLFHSQPESPDPTSTDTQEAEAQLLSTIKQFTQLAPSSPPPSRAPLGQFIKPEIVNSKTDSPSSDTPSTNRKMAPPASQATTVDLSQTQTPRHQSVVDVVWESPTRPVPSSIPFKLPTLVDGSQCHLPDSIVPYSMASSQLLTKSQLLPDSLLDDIVPGPPLFIEDSDGEEELE